MKTFLVVLSLTITVTVAVLQTGYSQTVPPIIAADSLPQYTYQSFIELYNKGIHEKLYLQTDKPYYSAGEKIWFKAYVINAITGMPVSASKFIYVELINRNDSLIRRVKIAADSCGFHNNIALEPSLPQGEYVLRAYTRWMRNEDDRFFFSKRIKIANPIDDAVTTSVSYSRDAENNIVADVTLRDQSLAPIALQRLYYLVRVDGKSRRHAAKTDDSGKFTVTFASPDDSSSKNSIAIVSDDPSRSFKGEVLLPLFDNKLDVQFFPEGGHLIADKLQVIAYKAIGSDGLSREIEGEIFSNDGTLLGEFETQHKGMGKLTLFTEAGKSYYAQIANADGSKMKINLPAIATSACAVKIAQLRGRILYQIIFTPDIDPSNLAVVVHSKGKIISAENVVATKLSRAISTEALPEGISQLAVIDRRTAEPIAQRAFFVRHAGQLSSITTDKRVYGPRESVALEINVLNAAGEPANGVFSVSVTDRNSVVIDTLAENIVSYFNLSSDIRGYVEEPAYYFGNSGAATQHIDLLMLTQGWTRFDIGDVMKRRVESKKLAREVDETISGEIKGFFGKAAKSPTILVFNPKSGYLDMFPLGKTNKFTITGFDYPDSTSMIIQAVSKSGGNKALTLNIDTPTHAAVKSYLSPRILGDHELKLPESFVSQSKEKYYYDGGMRVIDIESITVTQEKSMRTTMYNMTPSRSMSKESIEHFSGQTIFSALRTFPGVVVSGENISIRGSREQPLVYVDEIAADIESISNISMSDIESLDLVVGSEAWIFGSRASGGVILIGLKDGSSMSANTFALPSLVNVTRLGYKKAESFFTPKYEVAKVRADRTPDLRTTIHWDPRVVADSMGRASVAFFTADRTTTYDVVLEGIAADGTLVRQTTTIKREAKK